jgi:spermidine synthase
MAGNSILFTRDQFELYKQVLDDDGVICQWVHYYSMSNDDLETVLNTFIQVFPNTTVWRTEADLLLVGTKNNQSIDFSALNTRLQLAGILSDLQRIDIDGIYDLLGQFVMGSEALADYCKDAPIHTDNHPILQFSAPKSLHISTNLMTNAQRLQNNAQSLESIDSLLINYDGEANFTQNMTNQREFFINYTNEIVNSQNALISRKEGDTTAQEAYANAALAANEAMLSTGARDAFAHRRLGSIKLVRGEFNEAVAHLEQSVALNPTHVPTLVDLADAYIGLSSFQDARDAFSRTIELVNENGFLYQWRGYANFGAGNIGAAIIDYTSAIELYPANAEAYFYRGQVYQYQGEYNNAIADYMRVIELGPNTDIANEARRAAGQLTNQ